MQMKGEEKGYAEPTNESKADKEKFEKELRQVEVALESMKIRQRKFVERKLEGGEIKFDHKNLNFVYVETNEQFKFVDKADKGSDEDDYGDLDDSDDQQDEDEEGKVQEKI